MKRLLRVERADGYFDHGNGGIANQARLFRNRKQLEEISYESPGSIHSANRQAARGLDQAGYTEISELCKRACDENHRVKTIGQLNESPHSKLRGGEGHGNIHHGVRRDNYRNGILLLFER